MIGLQRAFHTAGAKATISTLWQIPDAATQKLMTRFYENLWQRKMPKLAALRDAQLWMLRSGRADTEVKRALTRDEVPAAAFPAGQHL